jgi:hypothetical protein
MRRSLGTNVSLAWRDRSGFYKETLHFLEENFYKFGTGAFRER